MGMRNDEDSHYLALHSLTIQEKEAQKTHTYSWSVSMYQKENEAQKQSFCLTNTLLPFNKPPFGDS